MKRKVCLVWGGVRVVSCFHSSRTNLSKHDVRLKMGSEENQLRRVCIDRLPALLSSSPDFSTTQAAFSTLGFPFSPKKHFKRSFHLLAVVSLVFSRGNFSFSGQFWMVSCLTLWKSSGHSKTPQNFRAGERLGSGVEPQLTLSFLCFRWSTSMEISTERSASLNSWVWTKMPWTLAQ